MRIALPVTVAAVVLACAGLASAQTVTRGDQTAKPTATPPARTTQTAPSRSPPSSALPVDPGAFSTAPGPTPSTSSPGPISPGGVRTVRPRRSADSAPDPGGEEIPYVDPPAAPGYEPSANAPTTTVGAGPAAGSPPAAAARRQPAAASAPTRQDPSQPPPAAAPSAQADTAAAVGAAPSLPAPLDPLTGWIALGGLAAMLAAAALGLRHILTAPHLSFRVTVDHGVQSAPRFKGAAS